MLSSATVRQWLSPLVAVLFLSTAVTGVLLVLEVRAPGGRHLHEIGGLLFAAGGVAHAISNWRALVAYFRKRKAWVTLGAGVLVCVALLMAGIAGGDHEEGRERGPRERHEHRAG
jgi:hypothetical protein